MLPLLHSLVPMRRMGMQYEMRRIPSQTILGSWVLSELDAPHPGWVPMRRMGTRSNTTRCNSGVDLKFLVPMRRMGKKPIIIHCVDDYTIVG